MHTQTLRNLPGFLSSTESRTLSRTCEIHHDRISSQQLYKIAEMRFLSLWATGRSCIAAAILLLSASASEAFSEHASGVVGLYWLPCAQDDAKHINIFASPDDKNPIGRIYYAKQERSPPNDPYGERNCEKPTLLINGVGRESRDRLGELPMIYLKYGAGATVLSYKSDWLEIKLDKGSAWVHDPERQRSQSVESLLEGDMTYIRIQPPVPIQGVPGGVNLKPVKVDDIAPYSSVRVLEWRSLDGQLWVKVKSTPSPPCGDDGAIKRYKRLKPFDGWLPFHDSQGQPTLWFFSGGC